MLGYTTPPIGIQEFYLALISQCPKASSRLGKGRFGIAVSGGVDSMTLSYLCGALRKEHIPKLDLRAFIVDHKVRAGSSQEARIVTQRLRDLGIPCTTLRLNLSFDAPLSLALSNFETKARRMRYQALGYACKHFQISSLLLAHHEDDQAETVLTRLLGGYTGDGLRGMQTKTDIPECHGRYGIHASGNTNLSLQNTRKCHITQRFCEEMFASASGGVLIYRPLLTFNKARLIATCIHAKVTWIEDATNMDCGLTIRNTVRKLFAQDLLPKALRKKTLLLVSKQIEQKIARRQAAVEAIVRQLMITHLDVRSGTLAVIVPQGLRDEIFRSSLNHKVPPVRLAFSIVDHLAQLITPFKVCDNNGIIIALFHLFQQEFSHDFEAMDGAKIRFLPQCSFTAAGVFWSFLKQSKSGESWLLCREPPKNSIARPVCKWGAVLSSTAYEYVTPEYPFWSWQLFDNRYWMRVRDHKGLNVTARLLTEADLLCLRRALHDNVEERRLLGSLLREIAPGKIRWSLPVLIEEESGEILALPTIEFCPSYAKQRLQWQILYKRV